MGIHDGHRARMQARFLAEGLENFAPHEALELLLYFAVPRQDTNPIAHALLDRYGSLSGVMAASLEDLQTVKGVGRNTALLLKLTPAFCNKAHLTDALWKRTVLDSSGKAGAFLLHCFAGEHNEVLYQLCLDSGCSLLSCQRLVEGTANRTFLNNRRLVENAITCSAVSVILAHNHPGGSPDPSPEDVAATESARAALAAINVELTDHIIVSGNTFTSMRQLHCMKDPE